jgi:hypothetical protein
MEKKCSKCETAFTCKNEEGGCWCEQFKLSQEVLQYLKDNYKNCLCPACLHEFSQEKSRPLANENQ